MNQLIDRLETLDILLKKGNRQKFGILNNIASQLIYWKKKIIQEKV